MTRSKAAAHPRSTDINRRFCLQLRRQAEMDLTARELRHFNLHATCFPYKGLGGNYHCVEWPRMSADGSTFRWEGQSDNRDHAKAEAITHWLNTESEAVRKRQLEKWDPDLGLPVPAQTSESEPQMAMLPNDYHPGPRCSCRECLDQFK
jgi:hypothetical protein